MKNDIKYLIGILAALVLLIGCDRKSLVNEYKVIDKDGWNKDSLLLFEIPVSDTLKMHQVFVNVRNDI